MDKTKLACDVKLQQINLEQIDSLETCKNIVEELLPFAMVFINSVNGILITDAENKVISINPAFTKITGYTLKEIKGRDPRFLKSGRHDQGFYRELRASLVRKGYWKGQIWNRRKNGKIYCEWETIHLVKDKKGEIINYFSIFSDITETTFLEENIQHLKQYDLLTNLPNRALFYEMLKLAIVDAKKSNQLFALHLISIDNLKKINESFGFNVGDLVIQKVAKNLRSQLEKIDILAHFSEDKFAVIQHDIKDDNDASYLAHNLLEVIKKPLKVKERSVYLTSSIGISRYPCCARSIEMLIKKANAALSLAEEAGGNNSKFFAKELNISTDRFLLIENRLHTAIERRELILYYQPQVEIQTGRIVGAEALIRWLQPDLGLVTPDRFIHIAERNGLIIPIGEWVLRTACNQIIKWQKTGLIKIPVAVNVSPVQFRQKEFKNFISKLLEETKLPPEFLELELTESAAMENPKEAIIILKELRSKGIRISIDDFGTGYSSLSYLRRFPIDKLKIDISFVQNIASDSEAAAVCNTIIGMAKSLKLKVIAEGVETRDQLIILRSQQCDEMQGYYFSKPLPANEFEKLLRANKKLKT